MDKMTMAHDYVMEYMKSPNSEETTVSNIVSVAWQYADAMQAEAEKREDKSRPDVLVDEWQPDWSRAPSWANWWAIDLDGCAYWYAGEKPRHNLKTWISGNPYKQDKASSFGYTGNWQNSLRKRP